MSLPYPVSIITHDVTIPTFIRDKYLHDPSTLPSNHLNVTVSVQDKDKEGQISVRRTMGKAVLDTVNHSILFLSL